MPAIIRMQIPTSNSVLRPNNFVRNNANTTSSNLGRMGLGSVSMINRLANSRPCGSCGH